MARGCTRNTALLGLARMQALCGRTEDALDTLAIIEDDPADPSVAVERDHTGAGTRMFSEPELALPGLKEAAERWNALGNTSKEAWARANAGVALFYLSRMEEAAELLERALELFEQVGDKGGAIATASFLCLVKPADRRVPGWLADALEFAERVGDRSREMTVLTTLAWHLFFRSFCGDPDQIAEASRSARRMAELAEELGANDMAIHGWSLLAIMDRMSGRIEQAWHSVTSLERVMKGLRPNDRWLAWAATFSVTVARGEWGVTPPFPPDTSPDPVSAMAGLIVEAELTMAGRASPRRCHASRTRSDPISVRSGTWAESSTRSPLSSPVAGKRRFRGSSGRVGRLRSSTRLRRHRSRSLFACRDHRRYRRPARTACRARKRQRRARAPGPCGMRGPRCRRGPSQGRHTARHAGVGSGDLERATKKGIKKAKRNQKEGAGPSGPAPSRAIALRARRPMSPSARMGAVSRRRSCRSTACHHCQWSCPLRWPTRSTCCFRLTTPWYWRQCSLAS